MNDLPDLLARWAQQHPNEFAPNRSNPLFGHFWTEKDEYGDADSNLWIHGDGPDTWAVVIGAVIYHASRRGLVLSLYDMLSEAGPTMGAYLSAGPLSHTQREVPYEDACDGNAALRAGACALLSAYLEATKET